MLRRLALIPITVLAGPIACEAPPSTAMHASEIANGSLSSRRAVVRVADRCSGTLVRPNVVLTAAHCVCSVGDGCSSQTTAKFIDVPNTGGHSSPIQGTVIPHPLYVPADPPVGEDLALVVLSQWPTQLGYEVSPIRIGGLDETVSVGDTVTFAGLGRTGDDCEHDNLVTRYEATATVDGFGSFAGSLVEIRVDDASHLCPGDSGGPLLNAAGRIVGVASRSAGNSSRFVGTREALGFLTSNMCVPPSPYVDDPDYCNDPLCSCRHGWGDCDRDSQCFAGGTCVANIGASFGMPSHYDVCITCPAFDPSDPDAGFCETPFCPCGLGQGDCDPNQNECAAGLVCGQNNGASFGLPSSWEVCILPGLSCGNGQPDAGEACDDSNRTNGDGCSSTCQVESGWICPLWNYCERFPIGCFPRCMEP